MITIFDNSLWKKKATAFVIRSHRHLWGKNNEDPLAFLFTRGLENQFMKTRVLGWNKFGQKRPMENWGVKSELNKENRLFLPSGIVVPFIVEKELKSVFILSYKENKESRTFLVPGSSCPTIILEDKRLDRGAEGAKVALVQNLFDGLYLLQETKGAWAVVIHPDPALSLENHVKSMIEKKHKIFIFSSDQEQETSHRQLFPGLEDNCFYTYSLKEEMVKLCLKN